MFRKCVESLGIAPLEPSVLTANSFRVQETGLAVNFPQLNYPDSINIKHPGGSIK